jgi:RHS repeat-associated protein
LTAGAATLASLAYARDGAGQVASQSGTGVGQPSETYGYSALEQLKTLNGTATFAYDAADDLTRLRGTAQAFDAASQITSSTPDGGAATAYGYDARGNRTSATPPGAAATAYGYDQESRLVNFNAGAATYAYDGNGLRSSKTAGGTTTAFTWDPSGGLPLVVKAATTAYVYGPGGLPLEQVAADGTTQWFFHDQLGSTRALTDSTGAVVATRAYDPYGKVIASTGTASTPFGFAGEWTDAESGFVYLRARFYDPATGQFLTRDPLVSVTRSPYGYVEGNPLNGTDPAGLSAWGWAKKHALEIAVVTVVAAVVACTVSVVCGLAVAGAVSAVSVVAGNAMLLGAAGIGTAGAIARALGGAPGCSEPAEGSPAALDATPGGRIYSAHYLEDTGPVRNIPGSVVDEVIDHGQVVERLADRTIYYQQANDMTVVQSETTGKIMSVRKGAP